MSGKDVSGERQRGERCDMVSLAELSASAHFWSLALSQPREAPDCGTRQPPGLACQLPSRPGATAHSSEVPD